MQQAQYKRSILLNALAVKKEYVQMRSIAETGKDGLLTHTIAVALVVV